MPLVRLEKPCLDHPVALPSSSVFPLDFPVGRLRQVIRLGELGTVPLTDPSKHGLFGTRAAHLTKCYEKPPAEYLMGSQLHVGDRMTPRWSVLRPLLRKWLGRADVGTPKERRRGAPRLGAPLVTYCFAELLRRDWHLLNRCHLKSLRDLSAARAPPGHAAGQAGTGAPLTAVIVVVPTRAARG